MADISDSIKDTSNKTMGFFKYVFDFDDENKNNMLNMLQYTILSIIPIILVLKVTRTYVTDADEGKGSLELLAESLIQIVFIVLSFWFINRIIQYIPTYSGTPYKIFNETTFILGFMFILLTIQTKLGEKIRILTDRALELWGGRSGEEDKKESNVKVRQPLSHQPSQADNLGMNPMIPMGGAPPPPQMTSMKSQTTEHQLPKQTNFNQMYRGPVNPLVGASMPGMMQEPMAANDGGAFGSPW